MVYRDHRQGLSSTTDVNQSLKARDRYLDNCFLLCLNRDDRTDVPEIHRLENHLRRELCQKNPPTSQTKSQQRGPTWEGDDDDFENDDDLISPRQHTDREYMYRRKGHPAERDSRWRYQQEEDLENYYNHDQYSRSPRFNQRDDYNIIQHGDDELSVYEIYVPTNTLNRLSDKRTDNNMVLIDYEDVSALRNLRGPPSPYEYSTRKIPSQYNNYSPGNQYNDYGPQRQYDMSSGIPRDRDDQARFYQNNPQRLDAYYGNEINRPPYSAQSGQFFPPNVPIDQSNAVNVRRHIYSPSQLPQGLTEGQLVMLLQKGSQYQPVQPAQQTQLFPSQNEPTSAVTVSHQPSPAPNSHVDLFKNPEYTMPTVQPKITPAPPQVIDQPVVETDKASVMDEMLKPMSTVNTIKPSKDTDGKKKEKSSDSKKEKKADKDTGESSKKDGKKEKSSGKDGKKKKK